MYCHSRVSAEALAKEGVSSGVWRSQTKHDKVQILDPQAS